MEYIIDSQGVKYKCQMLSEGLIAEVFKLEPNHSRNIKIPKSIIVDKPVSGPKGFLRPGAYQVVNVLFNAFGDNDDVESVILPDGIIEIAGNAFDNCTSLISVEIPDSVVKIGSEAFRNCKSLRSIVLPKNLELIDEDTFTFCSNLEYVKIGDNTQRVDKTAFTYCHKLKEVSFHWYDGRKNLVECHRQLREAVPIIALRDIYDNNDSSQSPITPKTVPDSSHKSKSGTVTASKPRQHNSNTVSRATQPYVQKTQSSTSSKNQQSGCYIATAVYGSYDCPEVWTLRRFRDNVLDESWYGRLFIRAYYAISPTLVKWFGRFGWFKKLFYSPLTKWVKELNRRGVENTPYKDKY